MYLSSVSDIEGIIRLLEPTPYSVASVPQYSKTLEYLLAESTRIGERHIEVQKKLIEYHEEFDRYVSQERPAEEIFNSNRLEFLGTPLLKDTLAIISRYPNDLKALREELAMQSIKSDRTLFEVIGLRQAQILSEIIADASKSFERLVTEYDIRNMHAFIEQGESPCGELQN